MTSCPYDHHHPFTREGEPGWWDSQATDIDAAKWAVWSVDPDTYDATTRECLEVVNRYMPANPSALLDVGCGVGRLTIPQARRFPGARVVGMDVSSRMLDLAASEGEAAGVTVEWVRTDGRDVPPGPYDGAWTIVVFQHNQRDVVAALVAAVAAELAPGGTFVFQTVSDRDFEDYGHVPERVVRDWMGAAGLVATDVVRGAVMGDWIWGIGTKPLAR